MALKFFKHTEVLNSPGVVELPRELFLEEAITFTIPAILKIIDNYLENGGLFYLLCSFELQMILKVLK